MREYTNEHGKWIEENGNHFLIEPTEEWIAINQPVPTTEQLLEPIRQKRNELLTEADKMITTYNEQIKLVAEGLMTIEDMKYTEMQYLQILVYKQTLRDLPETVNVNNPIYPTLLLE